MSTSSWPHQWPVLGFVLVCATVAATTALAAWLVQRSGQPAAGSGIPYVEAVIEGKLPAAPLLLLPIYVAGFARIRESRATKPKSGDISYLQNEAKT